MQVHPLTGAQVHQHALEEGPEGRGIRGDAEVGDGKAAKGEPGVAIRARERGRQLVLPEQRDHRGDAPRAQRRRGGGVGRFRARPGEEPTGSGKRGMDDLDHGGGGPLGPALSRSGARSTARGYRLAPDIWPLISILADWPRARIQASQAWVRFCSSTCFASSSRSSSKARGSAGWRSSDFTT